MMAKMSRRRASDPVLTSMNDDNRKTDLSVAGNTKSKKPYL